MTLTKRVDNYLIHIPFLQRAAIKMAFLFLLCVSAPMGAIAQNGIYWSEPIAVAESSFGNYSPRIALLADGTPAALWGKNAKIYFSKMQGNEFSAPLEINTNGISPDVYNFGGIDLAADGDRVFVTFEDFTAGIFFILSENGGETFELPVNVFDPPSGEWATLPSVGIDGQGNPLVSVLREKSNETNARYIMMRSDDGGLTFGPPVVASEPALGEYVCECCPSDIYAKGDQVWLVFRNNNNNLRDMWVSRSDDLGINFTAATDVDATDWILNSCPISAPRMAPLAGDSLATAWMSGASGDDRVYFSTLNGQTMEKGVEIPLPQLGAGSQRRPDIAGRNDTLGIVWEETGFGVNSTDLMFAFSKNGTDGLVTNVVNITDASGYQRFPSLMYSNGYFHLIYADASGSVYYQKGTVSEVNSANTVLAAPSLLKVISQPATNGKILLQLVGEITKPLELSLLNMEGRIVKEQKLSPPAEGVFAFETGNVPAGVYIVQARSGNLSWAEKVVVGEQ